MPLLDEDFVNRGEEEGKMIIPLKVQHIISLILTVQITKCCISVNVALI